ncbi:MAG: type II secretion system protein GspD, partial [Polyangiaceae bacterium]|nr:type II secretion system protein GspD [Polyangiaceae bacterium]
PPAIGSTEDIFEGQVKVTCDEASNKLVITSSRRDYAQLRHVIDELDEPRRQVFIEAVIMDVTVDRVTNWGIGYHGGAPVDAPADLGQGVFYGGENMALSLAGIPPVDQLQALALGIRGPDIAIANDLFGLSVPAFGIVLHAMAQDGDSNVLATPHILATDNVPAEISIGKNIPLQQNLGGGLGSLASLAGGTTAGGLGNMAGLLGSLGGGGFGAPRQDVGTKIKVTPHVNDSDQVRLELVEEISNEGAPVGDLAAVPIEKRTASTTLIVRDQQTVVIGGLMRDASTNSEVKIPVLGDIPILGVLFKQTRRVKSKSNLLLILTPYVIRDQDDLRVIFERKMQERQEFLDRYFVFDDRRGWEPPVDYARSNGLVEDIRQSILLQEERARLEEDAKPKKPLTHEMGEPIALPTLAGSKGSGGTAAAAGGGDDAPAAAPAAAPARTTRPRLTTPGNRAVQRTE